MQSPGNSELPLEKELAIHAGVAGIALSHQSTLFLSAENELSQLANLIAVFSIIGVITAYVDAHLKQQLLG